VGFEKWLSLPILLAYCLLFNIGVYIALLPPESKLVLCSDVEELEATDLVANVAVSVAPKPLLATKVCQIKFLSLHWCCANRIEYAMTLQCVQGQKCASSTGKGGLELLFKVRVSSYYTIHVKFWAAKDRLVLLPPTIHPRIWNSPW